MLGEGSVLFTLFVAHGPLAVEGMVLVSRSLDLDPRRTAVITVRIGHQYSKWLRSHGLRAAPAPAGLLLHETFTKAERKRKILQLDTVVKKLVGARQFELVTFDSVSSLNQLLITHPQCLRYSILEEGVGHHRPASELWSDHLISKESQPLYLESYSNRFFDTGWLGRGTHELYRISERAFRDVGSVSVLDFDILTSLAGKKSLGSLLLLPSPASKAEGFSPEGLFRYFGASQPRAVSVKFHPDVTGAEKRFWNGVLDDSSGKSFSLLPEPFFPEAEIAAGNCDEVVGWPSSSLAYAHEWGVSTVNLDALGYTGAVRQ
jgi:hypothetical protein